MLCAVRYTHQNPVKGEIVESPSDYKWSSYSAYICEHDNIISKSTVLSLLQGVEEYKKFMAITEQNKFLEPQENYKITDEKLLKEKKILNIDDIMQIYTINKAERTEKLTKILGIAGTNLNQISRVTGITKGTIRTIHNP